MPSFTLEKSRNNWKQKEKHKVKECRVLRNARSRDKLKMEEQATEISRLLQIIKDQDVSVVNNNVIRIKDVQKTQVLCLALVLNAVVSYRSTTKILNVFNSNFQPLKLNYIPHFTSVINWTLRLGLGLFNQVKPCNEPWVAIADHSIDFGTKKVFVVLRVLLSVIAVKGRAITLADCECIGLKICDSVNGEQVCKDLEVIFQKAGTPVAVLKDCDSTLQKGVRLLSEKLNQKIHIIDDFGHVTGNALKEQFEKTRRFKQFIKLTSAGANKLRQTVFAFIIPPKLRTKGRFQSIGRLGEWGSKMLEVLSTKNDANNKKQFEKLREAFPKIMQLKSFIEAFAKSTNITANMMKILKTKGLCASTYKSCIDLLNELPQKSTLKSRLTSWLDKHYQIHKEISILLPLIVSSDIIESLFGKFKSINARSAHSEMNRSVLLIPALCGNLSEDYIRHILQMTPHKQLIEWEKTNITNTMRKERIEFWRENTGKKSPQKQVG